MARCRVSYSDMEGVEHAVEVEAESLYEAVALAVAEYRQDDLNQPLPAAMTEFSITVYRPPIEHRIKLNTVMNWAKHTVKEGPAGIVKRQRVRALLGNEQ